MPRRGDAGSTLGRRRGSREKTGEIVIALPSAELDAARAWRSSATGGSVANDDGRTGALGRRDRHIDALVSDSAPPQESLTASA
jgi:hypothetical protein